MDLPPLVTIARAAAVRMHPEVARRPLPIDPARIPLDLVPRVAPFEPAAEADVALEVRMGAVLAHARLDADVFVSAHRHGRLQRIEVECEGHASTLRIAADEIDPIRERH